jgi:hypothetical protein
MTTRLELDSLDSAKYLYLRELSEPRDNSLRLVVQEAVVNPSRLVQPHPRLPELEEILKGASPSGSFLRLCARLTLAANSFCARFALFPDRECARTGAGEHNFLFARAEALGARGGWSLLLFKKIRSYILAREIARLTDTNAKIVRASTRARERRLPLEAKSTTRSGYTQQFGIFVAAKANGTTKSSAGLSRADTI